jgi:hypothetical protein
MISLVPYKNSKEALSLASFMIYFKLRDSNLRFTHMEPLPAIADFWKEIT